MSKYIIDVGEGYIRHGLERTLTIPVRINDYEDHWMDTRIPVTPYTEPDIEQVREETFKSGYDAACKDIDIKSKTNAAYWKGIEDAWEAARKIYLPIEYGGIPADVLRQIFNNKSASGIFKKVSASEAVKKIRQYEQEKQEIKVGDEVISEDDIKAVVIDMDNYLLHVLDENGVVQGWPREDVAKTDRHFPEIAAVLQKMREEKS